MSLMRYLDSWKSPHAVANMLVWTKSSERLTEVGIQTLENQKEGHFIY